MSRMDKDRITHNLILFLKKIRPLKIVILTIMVNTVTCVGGEGGA
jgi:hypothetical protein